MSAKSATSDLTASPGEKNRPSRTKWLAALLLLCCCWLVLYIVPKGLASAYYFKANYYLELWQRKVQTLDQNSWQQAADAIQLAVRYHPQHPHYMLTQAKINEWAWYAGLRNADQITVNDRLYQQAILMRPGWPNAYADYAYYLAMINFRITEAFTQLEKAKRAGPYTLEVFQRTLLIAANHWSFIDARQKAAGFQALEQLVKNSGPSYHYALEISRHYQLQRQFCLYLRVKQKQIPAGINQAIEQDFCQVRI